MQFIANRITEDTIEKEREILIKELERRIK
jgi:hypothetical protein